MLLDVGFQLDTKPLQRLVEFPNGLLFIDAFIALQPLDTCIASLGNRVCELRLAAARRAFEHIGFCSFAARYTVVLAIESAMYPVPLSRSLTSSRDENTRSSRAPAEIFGCKRQERNLEWSFGQIAGNLTVGKASFRGHP